MGVKHYDNEFKEQAVKLSQQRGNINSVARELGISSSQLSKWCSDMKVYGSDNRVSHTTVAKYMKQMGLRSKFYPKYRTIRDSKHNNHVADNAIALALESADSASLRLGLIIVVVPFLVSTSMVVPSFSISRIIS